MTGLTATPPAAVPRYAARALFAGTIFSSAFLLFLVQPLIAKQILPWFGGSATVWTICMVFFQVVLLAGYAYADWLSRKLAARWQVVAHVALLACSLLFLPIVADPQWKPVAGGDPSLHILGLLLATIGLPYFLLSTTGPLIQSWVSSSAVGAQVYRYFSLSNFASLVALVAYPFVIEPYTALRVQAVGWSWGYAVFALLCSGSALYFLRFLAAAGGASAQAAAQARTDTSNADGTAPTLGTSLLWLSLSAMGSWLLLGITNHLTHNVSSIPFLWILPLSAYLFTFVLAFESDRWYRRRLFLPPAAVLLVLCAYGLQHGIGASLQDDLPLYVLGLFLFCMFFHGELARMRPAPRYLTRFYLMLSLGGALGGIAVGLVAPHVLPAYYELGIGLVITAVLIVVVFRQHRPMALAGVCLCLVCSYFLAMQVYNDFSGARRVVRNFYGSLLTYDQARDQPDDNVRALLHGSIKHGEQYLVSARKREPTSYYGPGSGVALAIASKEGDGLSGSLRVGVIGLGAGCLAAYSRPGDLYRFYEINPQVVELAQSEFSFMRDSPAQIETVLGDARLSMEREPPQDFNVLAIDAFSGGSVPVHLLTVEAMEVYLRHMKADGIVAFHVTNGHLSLAPVVERIALAHGVHARLVHDDATDTPLRRTDWVLVSRDAASLGRGALRNATAPIDDIAGLQAWTDDFNDLFRVMK
ncbi:fused MFS/spermidine synthase [Uliginosibacterium sp. H1]|uniref:fused MFS/spermidine synthase n=1 Tax=Uliginosibacterium sp. H1 TaxID=3114757 RepID=UPI002E19B319|nr:fused MFS/spermidine synthase [Uliginosibacterium sp. H1]